MSVATTWPAMPSLTSGRRAASRSARATTPSLDGRSSADSSGAPSTRMRTCVAAAALGASLLPPPLLPDACAFRTSSSATQLRACRRDGDSSTSVQIVIFQCKPDAYAKVQSHAKTALLFPSRPCSFSLVAGGATGASRAAHAHDARLMQADRDVGPCSAARAHAEQVHVPVTTGRANGMYNAHSRVAHFPPLPPRAYVRVTMDRTRACTSKYNAYSGKLADLCWARTGRARCAPPPSPPRTNLLRGQRAVRERSR
eukprot:TRINITY_DN172_c5_g1_i1.p1 TRINITY_DN172_c5_g1~~TRINITY_DN172_c5_g1_i1.p1  ORF type:complete len:256 (-),score=30.56 TRINITY_DN172_c5_g1_i1:462-1229(-)